MDPVQLQELIAAGENLYVKSTTSSWFLMLRLINPTIERLFSKVWVAVCNYDFVHDLPYISIFSKQH